MRNGRLRRDDDCPGPLLPRSRRRREGVSRSALTTRLILISRWTKGGRRYDVEYSGVLLVAGARDPEHEAARALLALGVRGSVETIDSKTAVVRMRFDIETFAATRTVERDHGGLSTEAWRSWPSEISHAQPPGGDCERRQTTQAAG